ncbi:MAG: PilZ domain-containing protein [Deltaproteobacteria bacterium]|nr:PilZ domain-containing protein [Deltaproteobacteria bacterium]
MENNIEDTKETEFTIELVKSFPRSNKKLSLEVGVYCLTASREFSRTPNKHKGQTTFISPQGLEFQAPKSYPLGTLLKIAVAIPDYWTRKKKFIEYSRIDTPSDFKILAKVVGIQDIGKRGRKKLVQVETVNIDEIDEQVLKNFLQEAK